MACTCRMLLSEDLEFVRYTWRTAQWQRETANNNNNNNKVCKWYDNVNCMMASIKTVHKNGTISGTFSYSCPLFCSLISVGDKVVVLCRAVSSCNCPILSESILPLEKKWTSHIVGRCASKQASVLSRARHCVIASLRHCVQNAQILILDAQNSSECVYLDAQIMLLDTQNRSIGIQLVDFENWFQIWGMKSKRVRPNRFRKCIQMQIRCTNCWGDTFSTSLIGAFRSAYLS